MRVQVVGTPSEAAIRVIDHGPRRPATASATGSSSRSSAASAAVSGAGRRSGPRDRARASPRRTAAGSRSSRRLGQGATFVLSLPTAGVASPARSVETSSVSNRAGRARRRRRAADTARPADEPRAARLRGLDAPRRRRGRAHRRRDASAEPSSSTWGYPTAAGSTSARELRSWSTAPLIVLSAADEERARSPPSTRAPTTTSPSRSIDELLARVRAVRRCDVCPGAPVIELGDARRRSRRSGAVADGRQPVHLTPHQFELLRVLALNPGKLLTHRPAPTEVWGPGYGDRANLLQVNVSQLRRKLEPDRAPRAISSQRPGPGTGSSIRPEHLQEIVRPKPETLRPP